MNNTVHLNTHKTIPKLADMQSVFMYAMEGTRRSNKQSIKQLCQWIKGESLDEIIKRIDIYRGSVQGNLSTALGDIYPVCRQWLGDEFFYAMADRYVVDNPSRSASLDNYGENFAQFVTGFKHVNQMPYLSELCQLEWSWHKAFHAQDQQSVDIDKLQSLTPDELLNSRLGIKHSLHLITTHYAVEKIWQAHQQGDNELTECDLDKYEMSQALAIYRSGYDLIIEPIEIMLKNFIEAIEEGVSLYQLIDERFSEQFGQLLTQLIQRDWIVSIDNLTE